MESNRVLIHIDNKIIEQLNRGLRWEDIINDLNSSIKRYKKRDGYIQVSEKYLVNNWNRIEWKKRLTTMMVIQSIRRISDIKWIKENNSKFPDLGNIEMYKLLGLRDKLLYNQSSELSNSNSSSELSNSSNS
jgi:hypothetical protein